jgi:serine/threonine protein kinase
LALSPGTRLGPYLIVTPLGAGGMGEVYRAKDTRLGRDVAVKILPAHLSENADVRERFEREARAISSLNHPHICTLYDIGREGDAGYFVMELLDGESLAARLERGPLKLDEALRVGAEIAEALAAAHKQEIVHRDLKPGNVALTKSGAKVLDFGVAPSHSRWRRHRDRFVLGPTPGFARCSAARGNRGRGERILASTPVGRLQSPSITLEMNWPALLRAQAESGAARGY